jgi:hypothetical protein
LLSPVSNGFSDINRIEHPTPLSKAIRGDGDNIPSFAANNAYNDKPDRELLQDDQQMIHHSMLSGTGSNILG